MPKRKRQPEEFDVAEFLRESDDDLKSALHSLLRPPDVAAEASAITLSPELNLIPALNSEIQPKPSNLTLNPNIGSRPNINSPSNLTSSPALVAGLNLVQTKPGPRRFAIREMRQSRDAHTRAEQHVYECLWENGNPYDAVSRTITIGFGAMAKLVGLSESNARINLRSLIAKLAVEEIAEYNCERSVGRTYRVFNEAEILRRRREAGLVWYMRRTLAVVFVDPATAQPLLKRKPLHRTGS